MSMWDFFNEHWILAFLSIVAVTTLLESVLELINNALKIHAAKHGVKCTDSKGDN